MNIKVTDLKRFQKLASNLKESGIIPMQRYLRFGNGEVCKNIHHSFIKFKMPDANEDMLIPEKDLYSLTQDTVSEYLNIVIKKNHVTISDGRDKITVQTPSIKEFQEPPTCEYEYIEISGDFLNALLKASHFSQFIKDMPTYFGYVHVGEKTICAGDGTIAFHCPIKEDVKIVIEGSIAQFLGKQEINAFAEDSSCYYFNSDEARYGYSKSIIGWFDMRKIFSQTKKYAFTLEDNDLKSFNALSLRLKQYPIVTIHNGKMTMYDPDCDKSQERLDERLNVEEPFSYPPERMNMLISGLGIKELDFYDGGTLYYINNKENKEAAIIAKIKMP